MTRLAVVTISFDGLEMTLVTTITLMYEILVLFALTFGLHEMTFGERGISVVGCGDGRNLMDIGLDRGVALIT